MLIVLEDYTINDLILACPGIVNAMLLNEFLKEHRKIEQMEKQIEALTANLQKVSAQLELSKSAPQTVLNNH